MLKPSLFSIIITSDTVFELLTTSAEAPYHHDGRRCNDLDWGNN